MGIHPQKPRMKWCCAIVMWAIMVIFSASPQLICAQINRIPPPGQGSSPPRDTSFLPPRADTVFTGETEIVSSSKRLTYLVNDLLDFSRLKERDLALQRKPVDIRTLTDIVLTLSAPLLPGEAERMDGTVIADTVNLASRLEGLTKQYGASILISEHTRSRLPHPEHYYTRFLGKVQVKGKNTAVAIFEIYDGDPDDAKALKDATLPNFENGLTHYFAKEFTKAAMCFQTVLEQNPHDKTARLYLERSSQFMVQGVPDDWQGVEIMNHK